MYGVSVCSLSRYLKTALHIRSILNMYTPAEEYEVKVTREFMHEIQKKMQEKAGPNADKEPVRFPSFIFSFDDFRSGIGSYLSMCLMID